MRSARVALTAQRRMGTKRQTLILGAGVTGLAAGYASGLPVYEAASAPGGICSSYYVRPGSTQRLSQAPADGEAYRFEIGGGHWIFGGDPAFSLVCEWPLLAEAV